LISVENIDKLKRSKFSIGVIHYCTSIGDIQGNISFDGSMLIFTPIGLVEEKLKHQDHSAESNVKTVTKKGILQWRKRQIINLLLEYQEKNLAQWKMEINIGDLDECHLMILPSVGVEDDFDINQEYKMNYLLQLVLHGHGER